MTLRPEIPLPCASGVVALLLTFLVTAAPVTAESFTVILVHGATFETRTRPLVDPTDAAKLLLLTDQGNWIALARAEVRAVVSPLESRGFARFLDAVTIEVGWLPNDGPPDEPGRETAPADPAAVLARALARRLTALGDAPPYSVDQFVEPEAASGIPFAASPQDMPPVGSPSRFVSPQSRR